MVVQMGGVSSVDGAVWRCRKVRRRGKGCKSLPTATTTASSNTFWPTATNELEAWACRYYWCWRTFCESHVLFRRDGPLVFACYEKLSAFSQFCQAPCFPNVRAIATAITEEDPCQNVTALERSAKACVEPAIRWFLRKFNVDLYDVVVAFKAARPFCPVTIQWLKPTNALVESLRAFPFLDSDTTIDGLKAELPAYLAAAEDVVIPTEEKKVEWWCGHEEQLPRWASAVKQVLLVQPSSATADSISILKASFNEQQNCALVDYLQASVMSQYNKR